MATERQNKQFAKSIEQVLNDSRISKSNLEVLKKYDDKKRLQPVTLGSRHVVLNILRRFAFFVNKDFKDMTKEDVEKYFLALGNNKPKTTTHIGSIIKAFFKWFYDTTDYPLLVKWIPTSLKFKDMKLPSDLLTKEEVKAMADASDNLMDKALILVLYESACRITELLCLKIKDVAFDKYGCAITVNGKTGMRRIRLIDSSPDLVMWINNHPRKDDRDNPVFIHLKSDQTYISRKQYGEGLEWEHAKHRIKKLAHRAGIKKKVHPHLFRHSRLTELAQILTEAELRKFAGWAGNSNMAAVYVHLSGGDIEKKLLANHGLIKAEKSDTSVLKPKECPRCKEINSATARFCYLCGTTLDKKPTATDTEIEPVDIKEKQAHEMKTETTEMKIEEPKKLETTGIRIEEPQKPQTNDVISKVMLEYIFKNHPELILEFMKNNGMGDTSSLDANGNSGKNKTAIVSG